MTETDEAMPGRRRKILVVGCGAIGGIFAARLAAVAAVGDAAEVVGYDSNVAHVAAIRSRGLELIGRSALLAKFEATSDPAQLSGMRFDAVLLLVKSSQTAAVLQTLAPLLAGDPLWVTLQNGMGNSEILLGMPDARIARGVTMHAGRFVDPGRIEHLIDGGLTWIGPVRGTVEGCEWLGDALTAAGIATRVIPDPMEAIWSKFVFNSVMNPVGALMLGVNSARYEVPQMRELIDDMAAECKAVVQALGGSFAFDPMDFVHKVRAGEIPISRHAGSMSLDIQAGAPTEIEELTGYIVREGDRLGVPVGTCRTVYRLVKGLEHATRQQKKETAK